VGDLTQVAYMSMIAENHAFQLSTWRRSLRFAFFAF
jgi:hypothetical protein